VIGVSPSIRRRDAVRWAALFAALNQIDIELDGGGGVIVDERVSSSIEAEPQLSVLLAVTRVLQYIRSGNGRLIVYRVVQGHVPAFFREAVTTAGATVCCSDDEMMRAIGELRARRVDGGSGIGDPTGVRNLLNRNFAGLVERLRASAGVTVDLDGLRSVEAKLHSIGAVAASTGDQGRVDYWRSVFELGGFCGEVIRRGVGGRWDAHLESTGTLPLALDSSLRGRQAWIGALGKAIKYFDEASGESESPSALAALVLQAAGS
jgi:hypothetical protein